MKDDPHIENSILEKNWLSFLNALEANTPEIIINLQQVPFPAFRRLAEKYSTLSRHPFGALTCEWHGGQALSGDPLGDLARLLHSPETPKPDDPWPPSEAFWNQAMRIEVLELSAAIRDWGMSFQDQSRRVHWKLISAGLATMRAWLHEETAIHAKHWWGIGSCVQSIQLPICQAELVVPGWNPDSETEAEFKKRIAEINKQLSEWAKNNAREMRTLIKKLETKRTMEHFDWTALRIVRGLTFGEIAEIWAAKGDQFADLDESTVRKGIKSTLLSMRLIDSGGNRK